MIDTSLHNLIILQMFKVVMTWPEWKMGYFKKKRKEREEYIAQRKVLNFLLPRILPPKIAAPSMKRKCSAICKLSIWYVFSFQASKKCLPSLYAGEMGAYWAVRLPIPVSPQTISFWHIISIYSPICSFIRVYNKGYLYSRDAAVSLKVLPLHTGTEAFHLPSTHSSERLPTNLYPTLHSKDAIAPCENRVPYFWPFKGSVIFWHWARKYTATKNVIDYNCVYVTYVVILAFKCKSQIHSHLSSVAWSEEPWVIVAGSGIKKRSVRNIENTWTGERRNMPQNNIKW